MPISNESALIEAYGTTEAINFGFDSITAVSGYEYALNTNVPSTTLTYSREGTFVNTSSAFGSGGKLMSDADQGFNKLPVPGGSNKLYLTGLDAFRPATTVITNINIYDLLWHASGFTANITTLQSVVGASAITRNTSGLGNLIKIMFWTVAGSTASTVTIKYTNQDGTANRTATAYFGTTTAIPINRLVDVALQLGDTGVRSIESVQLSASTGTAGNFSVMIVNPICLGLHMGAGHFQAYNALDLNMSLIENNAALLFGMEAGSTSTNALFGSLYLSEYA